MELEYYPWASNDLRSGARYAQLGAPTEAGMAPREALRDELPTAAVRAGASRQPEVQGDTGAAVGIRRNLEFSAGGRAHRVSKGPYTRS